MADDSIPTFAALSNARRRSSRRAVSAPQSQLAFDLSTIPVPPRRKAYEPIVLTPAPVPAPPREPVLYTVRALIAELRGHLESALPGILNVEGEVSNCRPAASGHLYFTLKDGDAQLPVVLFRAKAQLLPFKLSDGLAVEARGRISVYESRGQLQLIAETLRPRGAGALQLAFEQLRDRLRAEGLFDRPRTPLPAFPRCIGVVTSPSGAALHDIITVIRRRHARLDLLIYPAVVQGPHCAASVAAGIRWFNQHPHRAQLILVARGGGSLEDLAGFNDESLARTIAASTLPVVSAIGHEIDHTIADFVADLRAATPSAAAELITAAQHRIEERLDQLTHRIFSAAELRILRARQRFQRLSATHVLARQQDALHRRQQRVDELRFRLTAAFTTAHTRSLRTRATALAALGNRLRQYDPALRLAALRRRLDVASARLAHQPARLTAAQSARLRQAALHLHALSPLAVLQRGYAIVYAAPPNGPESVVRSASTLQPGQQVRARLAGGSLRALVTETSPQ